MKKMYLNSLAILAISCLIISPSWATVFLANYIPSSKPISFMMTDATTANKFLNLQDPGLIVNAKAKHGGEIHLGYGNRTSMDAALRSLRIENPNIIFTADQKLSVRIYNGSYYDLSHVFKEIESTKNNNIGKTPVIVIEPPHGVYGRVAGWTYQIIWE